jgi:hypothetical protein
LSDTVTAILVDINGDRWYGSPRGLSYHTGPFLKNPYSWENYTTQDGLIHNNIQSLAQDSSAALWIGTHGGVSRLQPADTSWLNYTSADGLLSNDVRDIAVAGDGQLFFATAAGLSQLTVMTTDLERFSTKVPHSWQVFPAYPNPFNMSTTIKFEIQNRTAVKIAIFDVSGRLVNTILNSSFIPGTYTINWNGQNAAGQQMASGVYFASVALARENSILKLILLK